MRGAAAASLLLAVAAVAVGVGVSEVAFRVVKRFVCLPGGAKLFEPHPPSATI